MKRIAWIVTLVFLGLGAALWVSQSYVARWEPQIRSQLESRVASTLGIRLGGPSLPAERPAIRVHIGGITVSFLHKFTLKDVGIWDTRTNPESALFRAKEVVLTASLIDLPRAILHRNPLELIGLIQLDTPVITLSSDDMRFVHTHKASRSTPLWFALEWTQGTAQWKDTNAPHGAWSLYQAKGYLRIRGPRVDALARGSLEQAESVDLHITSLGNRWNAQGRLFGADIPSVLSIVQSITGRPVLPEGWTAQGQFDFDIKSAWRGAFPAANPSSAVREAHLRLLNAELHPAAGRSPLQVTGGLNLTEGRLELTGCSLKGEDTQLKLSGHATPFAAAPVVDLQAQGHIGRWPLDNVHAQLRRIANGWELIPTTVRLWEGTLGLKGIWQAGQADFQLTGNDLSLQAATAPALHDYLQGRLNAALAVKGSADDLRTTGSFWTTNIVWAQGQSESLRGGLEITPSHFSLRGASDDDEVQISLEGSRDKGVLTFQRSQLHLRNDRILSGHGSYNPSTRVLHLALDAKHLSIPLDIPHASALKGSANGHATFEGEIAHLQVKADARSDDFQIGASTPAPANATLRWTPDNLSVDASLGASPGPQGWLRLNRRQGTMAVQRLATITKWGKFEFKGAAYWENPAEGHPIGKITFKGDGRAASPNEGALWNAPYRVEGSVQPSDNWKGEARLQASPVEIHRQPGDPLDAKVRWTNKEFEWESVRWGKSLSTNGILQWGDPGSLTGVLNLQDLELTRWGTLLWPQMKEPIAGSVTGTSVLSGTLKDPVLEFTGKVRKGVWRAFHFDSYLAGTWKQSGLEPVTIDGTLAGGGQFRFHGRASPTDNTASGSLDLTQVDLKPLGKSLSFPHALDGSANATLTVTGPLNQAHLAGHVEGTALSYGSETAQPLKLQNYVMDVTVEPGETGTRLTFNQALAKTQEEEIHLNPGSFVDFNGTEEARLKIGAEIRNLHLSVFTLFGGLDMNGTWQIRPHGFALQGDLFTRSLYINDYQLEQGHVQAKYYDRQLSFQAPRDSPALVTGMVDFQNAPQLTFKNFAVTGKGHQGLRITGTIGPQKWNFDMSGEGLDIGTLGGLAGFPYALDGSANVKIRGSGDLEHPNVEGTLNVHDGRALSLDFKTGEAAFAWQGQRMTFTRLMLSDPGRYTLTGTGVFPLAARAKQGSIDKTIDFTLRLTDSNMGLLQSITPEVKQARGSVLALLQIKGTSDSPSLHGQIRVKNGDVEGAHYFRHVQDVQISADFSGDDLVISEFHGKSGKGEFTGGGKITFAGFEPKAYDLHLEIPTSKGVEVTVPELAIPESPLARKFHFLTLASQCDVKGNVTFKGPADAPVFTGQAILSNGHFTFPPSRKNPPPPGFMEWIRRISWDTTLHFTDGAWFENELVEANLSGELAIKGPSDKLKVDGGIDILGGKISYLGVEFDIRQARFDIRTNDSGTTPYVRGLADSQVQSVDPVTGLQVDDTITLQINYAPVTEIKPQLRSSVNPNLSQDKLLARVTQLDVDNLTTQERSYLYQQQMVRLLDTSLATPLARNLLKRTGLVDELHVSRAINPSASQLTDPNNPSAGTNQSSAVNLLAGTKYTVAKNLTNRMSLGYGVRFDEYQATDLDNKLVNKLDLRSDVELSYRLLNNLYFRGSFDLPNSTPGYLPDRRVTIEPRWRFGWWGNTNKPKPKPPKPAEPAGTKPAP
jgi:hypothetical protein